MIGTFPRIQIRELIESGEAELKTGPFGTQLKASEYTEEGTPVINVRNIGMGSIKPDKLEFISDKTRDRLSSHLLQSEDIVFGRKGAVERHVFIRQEQNGWFQGSDCLRLRFNSPKVEPHFASYYFLTEDHQSWMMNQCSHGATMASLNQEILERIEIPLPPLPEQKRIAGILSAYDELIENSQRRIKVLETMARNLYREWFVHFRYPGHENTSLIPSSLGDIPKGWEVKTVEDIVKRIPVGKKYDQKTVSATGTVPVFDQGRTGIIGYHDDEPGVHASESSPVVVFANHTCYQRLIQFPFSAIQNVLPFVSSPSIPRNIYWLHWATNGLVVFNDYKGHWPEYAAKTLVVPSKEVCDQFGNFVAPMTRRILNLEKQIQNLRKTRDLLLPRLLSGQIPLHIPATQAA
jgi:type I restriction enzyme S subunit